MSDNEIRQILIQRRREERREMKREEIKDIVEGIIAWASLFGLGYMMFLGAYVIGG